MASLTYRGYFERVSHMGKRWEAIDGIGQTKEMLTFRIVYVYFYWGLSLLVIGRRKKTKWSEIDRLLSIVKNAADCSSWNFKNKSELLTAEKLSLNSQNIEAGEHEFTRLLHLCCIHMIFQVYHAAPISYDRGMVCLCNLCRPVIKIHTRRR